jgi:hypothetical protein
MADEAHNGMARCVRTRDVGVRIVQAAHEAGVRRLAMEALPEPDADTLGPILLANLSEAISAHGGTAGILRDQAPPPLDAYIGVDGVIISTENSLT